MQQQMTKPRRMDAKYAGTCKACGNGIAVGDPILWQKGKGATHAVCQRASNEAAQAQRCRLGLDGGAA